ncbi:MAG: Flp pilus assembly protein CpaB [Actinomycetota bacterium]|nr:Flp pilus assembly protein CpaB [Actinomycetota bacterium]
MGRRTLLLLAAILIAAVGTGLIFVYAHSANSRAVANQHPVEVLVAKSDIPAGTSAADAVSKGLFTTKTITRAAAIPTALGPNNLAAIQGKMAISTIFAGQQIVPQAFGSSGQTSGLAVPEGLMAVSVQLGDPARVAGFVQPGSKVAIFVTLAPTNGNTAGAFTRLLLASAQVVAVGPTTAGTPASDGAAKSGTATGTNPEQLPRAILTLALSQQDAEKVIFAQTGPGTGANRLYFGLLNDKSKVAKTPGVDIRNLFS